MNQEPRISINKKNNYIQLLKFVACILITNSHCVYPDTVLGIAGTSSIFQVGGGWGNAIFFVVSGYLCGQTNESFEKWITKKYIRIVPITVCLAVTMYYMHAIQSVSLLEFIISAYWFVTALVVYYPIFYFVDKMKCGYKYGILCYTIFFVIFYLLNLRNVFFVEGAGLSAFKIYVGFGTMMLGGLIKKYSDYFARIDVLFLVLGCVVSFIFWVGIYADIIFRDSGYILQFLIPISRWLFAMCIICWAIKMNLSHPLNISQKSIVNVIADSTLEIYLIQIVIAKYIRMFSDFNAIILFWSIAIFGGIFLHIVYSKFCRQIKII